MKDAFLTKNVRSLVAVVSCPTYDFAVVEAAVHRGIQLIGGTDKFVHPNETIIFKPNVLWGTDPAKCVVTHPAVLRAVVKAFVDTSARLLYGDSSAGISRTIPSMEKCGYHHALDSLSVKIASFDKSTEVLFPEGGVSKRLKIADAVVNADGVINIPKLKSHGLTRMTGAVKNMFGCVPGLAKGEHHARFPDAYEFSRLLADIAAFVRPRLHIMDAIEAMEGNGPQSGTPKKLGVLLFSADPVALDTVACRLIHLNPEFVPTIAAAERIGLGTSDTDFIEIIGDAIKPDHTFKVIRKPPERIPMTGILRGVREYFLSRPKIVPAKCTRCARCVSVCPVTPRALLQIGAKSIPKYNYQHCIRCYCCQEVCPSSAIEISQPLLKRLLPFGPYISLLVTRSGSRQHR
jgi:uncharacterized protein (DUF362 family)/NAD-dependent dihydropyrimidine dehydrogenase PreA subunit